MLESHEVERRRLPALRNVQLAATTVKLVWDLAEQAFTSHVSKLLNKAAFEALATQLHESPSSPLVLFVDLSGFKAVNDQYGHTAGDALLAEVGQRLVKAVAPFQGEAYHFSGDEFGVVVVGAEDQDDKELAERMCTGLSEVAIPLAGGTEAKVQLYFGFAPRDGEQLLTELLKRAERAADEAKARREPLLSWTKDLQDGGLVSHRRKCDSCDATTSVQVRQSKKADGFLLQCGNCGMPFPQLAAERHG